jgi:hypothetical protein
MTTKSQAAIARLGCIAAVLLPLAGCTEQSQSPVAPGETVPLTAAGSSSLIWQVTRTVSKISDPSGCYLWQPRIGAPIVSALEIDHSDGPLRLVLDPDEPQAARTEYTGTTVGAFMKVALLLTVSLAV